MMRQDARTDANQTEIVLGLRDAGCSVTVTSQLGKGFVDIAVGGLKIIPVPDCPGWKIDITIPYNWLLELKCAGGKLAQHETRWHDEWKGQKAVVESLDEALDVLTGRYDDR